MRPVNYLFLALGIFLAAILILIVIHWVEVAALLSAAGSQILSMCLSGAIMIGGIILILSPIYR